MIEEHKMFENINVRTEDEMRSFARTALKERYGRDFELDLENNFYRHQNGHEALPFVYTGFAYPADSREDRCSYKVIEPNSFLDNYSINKYKSEIDEFLKTQMKDYGVEGMARAVMQATSDVLEDDLDASDLIHEKNVTVWFEAHVAPEATAKDYISQIRAWMDYLYSRDFNWYFELFGVGSKELKLFTLCDSDYGYKSSEDWSDERILEDIERCMRDSK
jgi:hypothetical protein